MTDVTFPLPSQYLSERDDVRDHFQKKLMCTDEILRNFFVRIKNKLVNVAGTKYLFKPIGYIMGHV